MAALIGLAAESLGLIGAGAVESSLGIGASATTAVTEIAGSKAGQFAGAAVLGKTSQFISSAAETGINTLLDATVSEETKDDIQKTFNDIIQAYNAVSSGDPTDFINYEINQKTVNEVVEDDVLNPDQINPNFNPDAVLPYGGVPIVYNPDAEETPYYADRDEEDDRYNILIKQQKLLQNKVQNISASELASFIIGYSTDLSFTKDPQETLTKFIEQNPSQEDMVTRISNFLADKSTPTSQQFEEIKRIYNGRSITKDSFKYYYTREGLFHIVATDEVGDTFDMEENTGYVLPAVAPYVYVGPFTKNDRPPTNSVIDFFAVFHDYGFRNGINRIADMKFVSRLMQNKDRMRPDEINFANSTIVYFSNVSLLLGNFVGSQNPEDVSSAPQKNLIKDDIFPVLNPSSHDLSPEQYQTARYKFYDELDKSLIEKSTTSSMFAQIGNNSINQYYAEEFGQMLVQII